MQEGAMCTWLASPLTHPGPYTAPIWCLLFFWGVNISTQYTAATTRYHVCVCVCVCVCLPPSLSEAFQPALHCYTTMYTQRHLANLPCTTM